VRIGGIIIVMGYEINGGGGGGRGDKVTAGRIIGINVGLGVRDTMLRAR
jgi:hypothetical protein